MQTDLSISDLDFHSKESFNAMVLFMYALIDGRRTIRPNNSTLTLYLKQSDLINGPTMQWKSKAMVEHQMSDLLQASIQWW